MPLTLRFRTATFFAFVALSIVIFHGALGDVASLSWNDERYTHILLIPFISLGLIYIERQAIFRDVESRPWGGAMLLALSGALYFVARWSAALGRHESLSLAVVAVVLAWVAGFVFFFGGRSAKAALFPLSLLALVIPIPPKVVEFIEVALQHWSAEMTHAIFKLTGTPVFREGLVFSLPGLNIEVAKQCSGIRSSISLLITALVLGRLFLRSGWRAAWLVVLTIPIAVFKNAVRITTLSWLGAFVSESYLHGNLHHRGGPIFAAFGFALLLPTLWLLRRGNERRVRACSSAERTRGR